MGDGSYQDFDIGANLCIMATGFSCGRISLLVPWSLGRCLLPSAVAWSPGSLPDHLGRSLRRRSSSTAVPGRRVGRRTSGGHRRLHGLCVAASDKGILRTDLSMT